MTNFDTGKPSGPCPGYVLDHIKAVKRGGAEDARAKDRWEDGAAGTGARYVALCALPCHPDDRQNGQNDETYQNYGAMCLFKDVLQTSKAASQTIWDFIRGFAGGRQDTRSRHNPMVCCH